ncbi:hypothetical protein TorRG33x02_100710 [Trema orientale]|uniref:Uncharacterized protein n=1 Tax=Trema orientale TaxID=63057 RepID=A0A2P5F8B2_TREOI|nr:hypothetical protein TorRG33x02_100710 [Trema orientale]
MNINSRFMFLLSLVFAATTICTAQQTLTGTLTFDGGSTPTVDGILTVLDGTLTVDDGTSITINGGILTVNGGTDLIVAGDPADVTLTGDIDITRTVISGTDTFTVSGGTLTVLGGGTTLTVTDGNLAPLVVGV